MKFALGKKLEMTQVWVGENVIPVTKVKVEAGTILQVKSQVKDKYTAVVVGYGDRKVKNISKPQIGTMKGLGNFRYLKEFRYNFIGKKSTDKAEFENLHLGDQIEVKTFEMGDIIDVQGTSKGKGFQGGVKRHGFHGQDTTHGTKDQVRMPGSVGAGEPQHVFKGTRMAGRMGNATSTVKNLEVIAINEEESTLLIKGALPGARNGVLYIIGKGDLKITKAGEKAAAEMAKAEKEHEENQAEQEKKEEAKSVKEEEKTEVTPKEEIKAEIKIEETSVVEPIKEEKTEEAPKAEKVEEKPVEKVEEKKVEPVIEKPAEEEPKDETLDKFNHLPKEDREKFSSPKVMEAIVAMEEKFKIDLIPVITKLVVKELSIEELNGYLMTELKIDETKAAELAGEIKEKVLK